MTVPCRRNQRLREMLYYRWMIKDGAIMKMILKTDWKIMHKPLIVCGLIPFLTASVFTVLCLISPPVHIQETPYIIPLFCWKLVFLLILFFYLIFISIRISYDGERLIFYKFFIPVKSFLIGEIKLIEYSSQTEYLLVNSSYAFVCRLFEKKDIDILLELLAQIEHIKIDRV